MLIHSFCVEQVMHADEEIKLFQPICPYRLTCCVRHKMAAMYFEWNCGNLITSYLTCVPEGVTEKKAILFQLMAWYRSDKKSLSETVILSSLTRVKFVCPWQIKLSNIGSNTGEWDQRGLIEINCIYILSQEFKTREYLFFQVTEKLSRYCSYNKNVLTCETRFTTRKKIYFSPTLARE